MKYKCSICNKMLSSSGHATRHVRTKYHFPLIQLQPKYRYYIDNNGKEQWEYLGLEENK